MALEKQLADTDSAYCTKVTSSNQSSIFISNLGDSELEVLFGADYKSDDAVRLRLNKRNLAFNAVSHVVDGRKWYKRKSTERWDINASWLNDRLTTLEDVFASDECVFIAYLNKDDKSTHRLYMKGMTSLPREDGHKDIALRDFLFSGDVIVLNRLENGEVSFLIKIPDDPVISWAQKNGEGAQFSSESHQLITYGAPGTGKSFSTDQETKGKATFRTTFHPDTDYSNFVGSYKPTKEVDPFETVVNVGKYKDGKISKEEELIRKSEISYDFVPQAFIRAYVAAWKNYAARVAAGGALTEDDQVYLVIEEINRGHCAQIFGDLFQLLDRNEEGFSDYPIDADVDLSKWLYAQFAADDFGDELKSIKGYEEDGKLVLKLCLPPNLFIRATMNTSDQSLFPMDSAFKRRWDWRYVPISEPDKDEEPDFNKRKVLCKLGGENKLERRFDWWEFLRVINAAILNATKSEDKQLGYFFVKVPNNPGEISAEKFAGKVLFYLYNDVFKDYNYPESVFAKKNQPAGGPKVKYSFKEFFDAKGRAKDAMVAEFLENLGIPFEDKQLPA